MPPLETLRFRSDFVAVARARKCSVHSLVLQARKRNDTGNDGMIRVGFTCSRKVGNAVARNRAKRRLRELARQVLPEHGHVGWDYVLVGLRERTASDDFAILVRDLKAALRKIHGIRNQERAS